jgi:hypothetical protein
VAVAAAVAVQRAQPLVPLLARAVAEAVRQAPREARLRAAAVVVVPVAADSNSPRIQ